MSVRGSGVKLRQRHRSPVLLHMAGIHHAIAPAVPEGPGAVVTASEIGATRFVTLDHLDRVEGIERPEIRHGKAMQHVLQNRLNIVFISHGAGPKPSNNGVLPESVNDLLSRAGAAVRRLD